VDGWIKLHRKLLDWEWSDDPVMIAVWIHFLIDASFEKTQWRGATIERGQLTIGRKAYSKRCGVSEQQLRTAIDRLIATNEITTKSTNKYTVITIVQYGLYQSICDIATNGETNTGTNEQPTNNQQITTTKELKKERSKETISLVDSKEKPARKKDDYAWFDELWKAYPRKEGKSGVSNKAKDEIKKTGLDVVMSSIVKYRNKIEGKDPQYTMLGSTFFNGRYKDYIDDTCVEPEAPMPYEVIDDGGGFKLVRRTG